MSAVDIPSWQAALSAHTKKIQNISGKLVNDLTEGNHNNRKKKGLSLQQDDLAPRMTVPPQRNCNALTDLAAIARAALTAQRSTPGNLFPTRHERIVGYHHGLLGRTGVQIHRNLWYLY